MRYACPECERTFDENGFCPFDGNPLASPVDGAATVQRSDFTIEDTAPGTVPGTMAGPLRPAAGPNQPTRVQAVSAAGSDRGSGDAARAVLKGRADEVDRLVGETLDGRYVVMKKLGEGGMGVVYQARHAVIERPLAIKVLKREATRDTATIQRFVQEAKASSRIGHPNIVEVTDFGTTPDGLTYSVMELVDGATLSKTIKASAPFPPERTVRIALQIARAIGAAHGKGIVHRDLKPENVFLVDRDGRPDFVKIVDFGIAKVQPVDGAVETRRLTKSGSVFGTPEYMAPEQAAGRNDTDQRVDIYALGTILYEMLTGRVPHKSNSMVRTIAMQMLDPIPPMRSVYADLAIPPAYEALVMKALAKNRDDRYPSMAELGSALEAIGTQLATAEATTLNPGEIGLPPMPPGAPAAAVEAPSTIPETAAPAGGPPRRAKPMTRKLHEPEFVAGPLSLQVAFDEPAQEPERATPWPWITLGVVLLVGGAVAVAIMMTRKDEHEQVAEVPRDAATAVVHATRDAAEIAEVPDDAGTTDPVPVPVPVPVHSLRDAGVAGITVLADAATGSGSSTTAPTPLPGPHPRTITIEVLTRPAETDIFAGHAYLGMSGTRIERPWGTKLQIECKAPHYHGRKTLLFDGSITSALCNAQRLKMCVAGLKNPYDECEEPPSGGP